MRTASLAGVAVIMLMITALSATPATAAETFCGYKKYSNGARYYGHCGSTSVWVRIKYRLAEDPVRCLPRGISSLGSDWRIFGAISDGVTC